MTDETSFLDSNYRHVDTCATCMHKDFREKGDNKWTRICVLFTRIREDGQLFLTSDWFVCDNYRMPTTAEIILAKEEAL